MMRDDDREGPARARDIRTRGFTDRVSVEQATRWIDAHARLLPDEDLDSVGAVGRILAEAIAVARDIPPCDRATQDGYALRAGETAGAGDYSPLIFTLENTSGVLPIGAAALIASGAALPTGADAIMPFEAAQSDGTVLQVFGAIAQGSGVEARGQQAGAGSVLIEPGRSLRVQDLGLLSVLGLDRVRVVQRPRVRLIVAGPKPSPAGAAHDADGPMLRDLVRRDGGIVSPTAPRASTRAAMVAAMAGEPLDAILVAGRTGTGPDDEAPLALAEAGELAIHGIAVRPGGSAGMGLVGDVPVILLPGDPLACLCAYELFAGRLIRRLAGRNPDLPHSVREVEVGRKIVSAVGSVDLCQIRFVQDRVEPVGSAEFGSLPSAVRADGFILVPAPLEGYAPGARVAVRVYPETGAIPTRS